MIKKLFAFLICAFSVMQLSGCSSSDERRDVSSSELPELRIGTDLYKPYYYIDESGSKVGIDKELAEEACRRMGYEPVFVEIDWENKNQVLEDNEVDCLWNCFTMTGREDQYLWAGPYLHSDHAVVVPKDSNIFTLDELNGRTVAVQASTKAEQLFLYGTVEGIPDVSDVYSFTTIDETFSALRRGYADAAAGHRNTLKSYIDEEPTQYRLLDEPLFCAEIGAAFRKDGDAALAERLTETLNEMKADGTTGRIVEKYGLDPKEAVEGVYE